MKQAQRFPGGPESAAAARRFVTGAVAQDAPEALDSVELMVSELATNCIRHTDSEFEVAIVRAGAEIRIEVTDSAGGVPRKRSPGVDEPTGRGLQIVELLSSDWGVEFVPDGGKTVWFTIPAPAASCQASA